MDCLSFISELRTRAALPELHPYPDDDADYQYQEIRLSEIDQQLLKAGRIANKEVENTPIGARFRRRERHQRGNHDRRTVGQHQALPCCKLLGSFTHER